MEWECLFSMHLESVVHIIEDPFYRKKETPG
jgi:hypothetical protein